MQQKSVKVVFTLEVEYRMNINVHKILGHWKNPGIFPGCDVQQMCVKVAFTLEVIDQTWDESQC